MPPAPTASSPTASSPTASSQTATSQTATSQTATSVIVLCGGTSRRMGGADKTRALLGATTVLDRLLDTLPSCWDVVCVGEERPTTRAVTWCREEPPRGGPVAGIAAGLLTVDASVCVVVGGDMPFAAAALPTLLEALNAQRGLDAVLGLDPKGRRQPLLAAYRVEALRSALPGEPGGAR
ncbi:MAG: NTP transferase domain-containing protein, partial [Actinobacteria bacterium]|nr:NTP transferase domain-containing protein [Actinomycetota bacterium]